MKMRRTLAALMVVLPLALACGGGSGGSSSITGNKGNVQGPNQDPMIQGIFMNPAPVPWGGTAEITVMASDPDGQALRYAYVVMQGTVTPHPADASRATYRHNGQAGGERLTVTVTDERNGTAQSTADISIAAPPTPPPQGPPTSTPPSQPPQQPPTSAPTVTVSVDPRSCHPPCDVTFSADATGAESYQWSGCAGQTDRGGRSVKCAISRVNTVTATCTVSNSAGSASASASAFGTNGAPTVAGGSIIKAISADLTAQYQDPDK